MSRILTITLSALTLAACVDDFDKSADASCKRLAPAARQAQWELVAPGVLSLGMDVQTKKRLGVDSSNHKAANIVACPNEDNKGKEPQNHDLQKIGAARSSSAKSRL